METSTDIPQRPEWNDLRELPFDELIDRYRSGTSRLDAAVLQLSDEQADQCFLPDTGAGRWSCRMLLGHLADAEVICTFRMRRMVAEPGCEMAMWDQDAFIDAGFYGSPAQKTPGFVAVIHTLRLWGSEWLAGLPEGARSSRSLHRTRGQMSLPDLLSFATWHLEHHAWFLDRKLTRLTADVPPE